MDPNATLQSLREMVEEFIERMDSPEDQAVQFSIANGNFAALAEEHERVVDQLDEMVALFQALDGWISRGGFLPSAWARHHNKTEVG